MRHRPWPVIHRRFRRFGFSEAGLCDASWLPSAQSAPFWWTTCLSFAEAMTFTPELGGCSKNTKGQTTAQVKKTARNRSPLFFPASQSKSRQVVWRHEHNPKLTVRDPKMGSNKYVPYGCARHIAFWSKRLPVDENLLISPLIINQAKRKPENQPKTDTEYPKPTQDPTP